MGTPEAEAEIKISDATQGLPRLRKGRFPRSDELPARRTQIETKRSRRACRDHHHSTSALVRRLRP
jgi:hypothetical protein